MTMELAEKKEKILRILQESDDELLIDRIEKIVDFYRPQPLTIQEMRERIEEGEKARLEGKFKTHEEVKKLVESWKKRESSK